MKKVSLNTFKRGHSSYENLKAVEIFLKGVSRNKSIISCRAKIQKQHNLVKVLVRYYLKQDHSAIKRGKIFNNILHT